MAVLKCKMCGGELAFEEGATVCECEYCGSKQTIPNVDDEKRVKLYERANRLRLNNEFDKAYGVYESIIAESSEEAEAYWGLVLCKYGIEYVDDPATGDKVPTCHRSSFDSVMDDENFEMVMENADSAARSVYREQAKAIEEIRKGIIEVSSKEEPYDIFICYKETDENGDRTVDSLIAQDTYDALTEKGYKVFFSRITLEDKLGQEYEPYIFAALNSAKVMLAFGTSYDYYNAVWVKNEWSRFLQLMAKGEKKTLIPCYKNIDAYDIPKEFAKLQAQDMGKVGALQDLMRGIEKIIPIEKPAEKVTEVVQVVQAAGNPTVDSLLERVELFLEDSNWDSAKEYCEKVLDIEPKNAKAYLYKTCVAYKVTTYEQLGKLEEQFEKHELFQKALRFADDIFKEKLENLASEVQVYRENMRNCALQHDEDLRSLKAPMYRYLTGVNSEEAITEDIYRQMVQEKIASPEERTRLIKLYSITRGLAIVLGDYGMHSLAEINMEPTLSKYKNDDLKAVLSDLLKYKCAERHGFKYCLPGGRVKQEQILKEKREQEQIKREREEEERRLQKEREEEERKLKADRRSQGVCQHCGGILKGLFSKTCTSCGKTKDY